MQLAAVTEVLGIALCPLLLWMTLARPEARMRRSVAAHGSGFAIPRQPLARLDRLRITSVLAWEAELLVAFDRADGSWVHPDAPPTGIPLVVQGLRGFAGVLRLPGLGRDKESRRLVEEWQREGRALLAVLAHDGLTLLADVATHTAVTCRTASWGLSPRR